MKFYIGSGLKNFETVNYMSQKLKKLGFEHTFNWAENIKGNETKEDLINLAIQEQKAIKDSDIVILLLPAGRGSHIEFGMALALNKRIYLCANDEDLFKDTVAFYELPEIIKLSGSVDNIIEKIIKLEGVK